MNHPKAPDVEAISAWPNRTYTGYYVVEVKCPYCPKNHTHGWGGPGDSGGHRLSHCADPWARKPGNVGYNITIPDGFKVGQ